MSPVWETRNAVKKPDAYRCWAVRLQVHVSLRAAEADELRVWCGVPGRSVLRLYVLTLAAGLQGMEWGVSPTVAHAPCVPAVEGVMEVGDEILE